MGETVRLKASDGFELSAYVAKPARAPKGGLVVVQEIFGVNGHIKRVADGFAADGFLAIAPELFERIHPGIVLGYTENDIKVGIEMKGKSPTEKALADIAAARDFLKGAGKVGVIGYCWGGFLAWVSATRLSGFDAAVSYYGGGIGSVAEERPKCPVLMHFGEKDHAIPLSDVEKVRASHPTGVPPATASTATNARATTPGARASHGSGPSLFSWRICAEGGVALRLRRGSKLRRSVDARVRWHFWRRSGKGEIMPYTIHSLSGRIDRYRPRGRRRAHHAPPGLAAGREAHAGFRPRPLRRSAAKPLLPHPARAAGCPARPLHEHRLPRPPRASRIGPRQGEEVAIGEGRYVVSEPGVAEFAVAVADAWQGQGIGRLLVVRLECRAAVEGVIRLVGEVLPSSRPMHRLAKRLGFAIMPGAGGEGLWRLEKRLEPRRGASPCVEGIALGTLFAA
jgi:carboxymethylenebutenolidase